jgi:hypothetical protein
MSLAVAASPDQHTLNAEYIDSIISFNVKVRLAALGLSQTMLGEALGIKRASMSQKMTGRSSWSATDLVNTAVFLHTSVESLLDDSLKQQLSKQQPTSSKKSTAVAGMQPQYFVEPTESAPCGIRTHNPRLKRTLL